MSSIIASGNHYVCQVKANQSALLSLIKQYHERRHFIDQAQVREQAHGRKTRWTLFVYEVNDAALSSVWANLSRFIVIEKLVVAKGQYVRSFSYRISDVDYLGAEDFLTGIRGHWGIENRSHWVRDVILGEDSNGLKHAQSAINMAILNVVVVNFLRHHISFSIKHARIIFGQNMKSLFGILRT